MSHASVDLPSNFAKYVNNLNAQGKFAVPLQLSSCAAALSSLGRTRLMFEVIKDLPAAAYEPTDPSAWVISQAEAKYEEEGISDPILNITEDALARIEWFNSNGILSDRLDFKRIGFYIGGMSPTQQSWVLNKCEKEKPDGPNSFVAQL